jgi:SpoVK/Ycf46/Vps4 family AAA+-type ATPase
MRRVNADNLFYGEVLVDKHVWIDANTRGMNEEGEKSADSRIEYNHKVILQITNWRFLVTILDGAISEHKGYWDFSWGDIEEIYSSDKWTTILLKDKSSVSFRNEDPHLLSIKLWALGEAIKTEDRNGVKEGDIWRQSQSISFSCDSRVPYSGDWCLLLRSYGITLEKGSSPKRLEWDNRLSIDVVKRAFSRKNLDRIDKISNENDVFRSSPLSNDFPEDKDKKHVEHENERRHDTPGEIWDNTASRQENSQPNASTKSRESEKHVNKQRREVNINQRRTPAQQKVLNDINALIGLEEVKERIEDIVNLASISEERKKQGLDMPILSLHMVFTGNPGTGKTTIARMLGEVFKTLGLLSKGHFVEVDRASLVAGFIGQTAIKTTKVLEDALGGILFIDEAYTLSPGLDGDEFGQEAIDTILAFMENHRDDIVVIAAGYTEEMRDFVNSNPGLKSRFNTFIHFDDYSPDEMKKIFLSMAYADRYVVHGICDAGLDEIFSRLSSRSGKGFGNGREVRNIYEKTLVLQNRRLMALATIDRNQLVEILPCDLPLQTNTSKSNESKGLRTDTQRIAIGKLVGIDVVKQEISRIIDMARVSKVRAEAGLPLVTPSLHMVFTGSPGTGKTTVARCLAQELYDMGVMARNQVVEVSRSELVAGYVGQTAIKTTKVLDTALGGILFIDEAYSLNQSKGGSVDPFGLEAIDTILKYMEDNKESIMVIAAGYKEEMSDFLESNPGLTSRFNRFIHFPDYSDAELFNVFKSMAKNNQYVIREDALDLVAHAIGMLRIRQGEKFSNARAVRNLFEKTIENQASRLVRSNQLSREEIEMIIPEDVSPLINY